MLQIALSKFYLCTDFTILAVQQFNKTKYEIKIELRIEINKKNSKFTSSWNRPCHFVAIS